jgi:hypothetical protein
MLVSYQPHFCTPVLVLEHVTAPSPLQQGLHSAHWFAHTSPYAPQTTPGFGLLVKLKTSMLRDPLRLAEEDYMYMPPLIPIT